MKGREIETVLRKHFLPELPGFSAKRSLMFANPVGPILHGIYFDTSGFDRNLVYANAFVQPLYVPIEFIYYTLGTRIGGGAARWALNSADSAAMSTLLAAIRNEGLPFLGRFRTAQDVADRARALPGAASNPHVAEIIACSLIYSHDYSQARQALHNLRAILAGLDETNSLESEMLERSQLLLERLDQDPQEATNLLEQWVEQTRAALRLPE